MLVQKNEHFLSMCQKCKSNIPRGADTPGILLTEMKKYLTEN